jgi:CBS domain-containing protein
MAWIYPDLRYYYDWYDVPPPAMPPKPTDGWIKSAVVDQLRANPFTKDAELLVDVKRGVVILQGVVASRLAKRAAGDDAWDTPGVTDVSNQLEVAEGATSEAEPERVAEVMTPDVVALEKSSTLQTAAQAMRDEDVGTVVVTEGGHVTGLVSDRDIVVRAAAAGRDMSATTLGSIESKDVKTVAPQDPVERAVGVMRDHAIRRVVVVDEDDKPVGVVSIGDLAKHRDPGSVLADISSAPS